MKNSTITSLLIGLLCLYTGVNSQCPVFYADYDQQGNSFQQCSSGNVAANWNDQVSSFVVPAGYTVQLYADGGYGGRALGPYKAGSYNVPADFNDELSSIRISKTNSPSQNCPTFYGDYNQQGDSFQQCSSGNVAANWNDQVSSFVVPAGYTVQLYADGGYGGKSYGPYSAGSYNVPAEFNDQLSSIRISKVNSPSQNCPTFYGDYNQEGDSFQQCSSGNVAANWNDQVSSFVVPAGYTVQLYADGGYRGKSYGPYSAGSYNVPAEFNDQLSSIRISRAQPQPQPVPPQQNCPTFFESKNQRGDSFQMCSSGDVPKNWNNKASSFIVPAGFTVYFYQHDDFEGDSIGPYTQGTYNMPSSFDNRLTSARIIRAQPSPPPRPQPQPARNCPIFYTDYDQKGKSFQLCSSGDVPAAYNDQVSSFYIPSGFNVRLHQDFGSSGQSIGPYGQGSYNVPSNFNDQLSSVTIRRR